MWVHIGGPVAVNLTELLVVAGGLVLLWSLWKLFQRKPSASSRPSF